MAHAPTVRTRWVGWVVFAGLTMIIVGTIEVMMSMVAFFNRAYYYVAASALAVHINYGAWGWIQLLIGLVFIAAGYGLIAGQLWARITAVVIAFLSAVANLAFIAAYPWWALTVIALDVVIIYAVTVHGAEARL